MLHRVGKRDPFRIPSNQNMVVHVEEVVDFVRNARANGWSFISLDEMVCLINKKHSGKKVIALTFDDGYLDNYNLAFPVLSSLDVPFCVYITTGFIESNVVPWWYRLEVLLSQFHEIIDPNGNVHHLRTLQEMDIAFMRLRNDLMSSHDQYMRFATWLDSFDIDLVSGQTQRLFMTWNELEILAASNLVTIGAHTHTHPVLSTLEDDYAFHEIYMSSDCLSTKLKRQINHFAFPFGGINEVSSRDVEFVRQIGFRSAVSTVQGVINTRKTVDLHSLPRVFFGPHFDLRTTRFRFFKHQIKQILLKLFSFLKFFL